MTCNLTVIEFVLNGVDLKKHTHPAYESFCNHRQIEGRPTTAFLRQKYKAKLVRENLLKYVLTFNSEQDMMAFILEWA
jgi:hypothetical protein